MKISSFPLLLFAGTIASLPDLGIASCESLFNSKCQLPILNQDQIKFYAWNQPRVKQVELKIDNDTTLKEFFGTWKTIFLYVYFHDIGGNGLEKWIQDNKEHFWSPSLGAKQFAISVDYQTSVLRKPQAIRNLEPIANRTAELLIKIKDLFSGQVIVFQIIGHGFGALIASSVAKRLTLYKFSYLPNIFTALDPEIIDDQDHDDDDDDQDDEVHQNCKQIKIPHIHKGLGNEVYVVHTSTCSHTPVIPACDGNTTYTMGHGDFYPNGGGTQPGCLQTDSSCSRKRAPEIFAESNAASIFQRTKFILAKCLNFNAFENGGCSICANITCYEMNIYFKRQLLGRFYFYTNSVPPYARGYNQTHP